jgi:hypothetical protein
MEEGHRGLISKVDFEEVVLEYILDMWNGSQVKVTFRRNSP